MTNVIIGTDEASLLLTGILIPTVVVAGLRHLSRAHHPPRARLIEANIDYLHTVNVRPCTTLVRRDEITAWIAYGTSSERKTMPGNMIEIPGIQTMIIQEGTTDSILIENGRGDENGNLIERII